MTTIALEPITLPKLTEATVAGSGVFDVLMRSVKGHLEQEFTQSRIKGAEYATVYLGSLEAVLNSSIAFLLQKDKNALEALLVEQQIALAKVEIIKANAQVEQVRAQTANLQAELLILQANALKIPAEIALLGAQKTLVERQGDNEIIQGTVLTAQKCKLDAEFDLLLSTNLKTVEESKLLLWKTNTEKAQTTGIGVDENSVIGKQKALYGAQANGFTRDAEQKAADLMTKTWMTRRTTDEGTVADSTNMLNDAAVGRAVNKLLSGVGA